MPAGYIGEIRKGEKPANLPVGRARRFEMIVNVKSAKALGFKIPQPVLAQATKVIKYE